MSFEEVWVLIPSHSIEDFPTDLAEKPAASLLNCFAVAFHPTLIAQTGKLPNWRRADDPMDTLERRLFFVPLTSDSILPSGWKERAKEQGACVVSGLDDRKAMAAAAIPPAVPPQQPETVPTAPPVELDPDVVADFYALGTCWLLLELLTRHMHHYSSYDETFLKLAAVEGAQAAVEGRNEYARDRLQACFDLMTEARERFYLPDSYLIELCLLTPEFAKEPLRPLLLGTRAINYLLKASDAEQIAAEQPELIALMKEAWGRGAADIVGGDYREIPSPLVPLESTMHDLEMGRAVFRRLFDRVPTTWARKRYGLSPMLPQILQKYGYHSGLHVLLDDGIYPDREQSRIRWDGCDSSAIDSYTRIPLAADSSSTYVRLPQRLAETMQSDQMAALVLARWPDVKCPIHEDLRRVEKYAPVLGRSVSFDQYFQHSDASGGWGLDDKTYLAPFMTQAVARREQRPISRYSEHAQRCARLEAAVWRADITQALYGRPLDDEHRLRHRDVIEAAGPDAYAFDNKDGAKAIEAADQLLSELSAKSQTALAKLVLHGGGSQSGCLVTNPTSFQRRVIVNLPEEVGTPAVGGPVKAVQVDSQVRLALVDIPAAGFAWFPSGTPATSNTGKAKSGSMTEGLLLQNELFEVQISNVTGGLQRIKLHGRHPNRLSQQLAMRFPREKTIRRQDGDDLVESKTWYSEMRFTSSKVTSSGPLMGEIVTTGDIIDPTDGSQLATFQQTFRAWMGRPFLEIDIELDAIKKPEGDPWSHYIGSRFAWNDSGAALTGSLYGTAQPLRMERIESLDFLEIASDAERTTILPFGTPFHRKTGMRMVDSILIAEGETERKFRFVIAIDQNFPGQLCRDLQTPVEPLLTQSGPPRSGATGWFYHVDSRCVQVTKLMPLMSEGMAPVEVRDDDLPCEPAAPLPLGKGFALRMQETEGRYQSVLLELFRRPSTARVRDFQGRTTSELTMDGDSVRIEFSPFSIVDVEVRFDG